MASDAGGVVVWLLVVAVVVAAGAATGDAGGGAVVAPAGPAAAVVSQQVAPETDNTVTRIVVHENGSATWTLRIRTRLETDEAEAEYRVFQDRFRRNASAYLGAFRASITGIIANARGATGREMAATGFRATTSIQTVPRRWGVVTFEFRWDGFAGVEGDRLLVGDVFVGGLFIDEGDALEVVAPAGYRIAEAAPDPDETDEGVVTWRGPEDFADRQPAVLMAPTGAAGGGSVPHGPLVGVAAILALVALVGYRRWRAGRPPGGPPVDADGANADPAAGAVPLADEDRVRRAVAEAGGRMRQTAVAETLGWSRSKTSRVLARMEDDGRIRKLRLGRENVIALPEDPDD